MPERELFVVSIADAASTIGVSASTIRRWSDKGFLPTWRTPTGERRFRQSDIDTFVAKVDEGVAS